MATQVSVQLAVPPEQACAAETSADAVLAFLREVDARLSRFHPQSELCALNRTAGGWFAAQELSPVQSASFVDRAIIAYNIYAPEVRHPVEVAASDRDQLVSWLSKRIGEPLKLPDLTSEGYTLLGGRLLAAEDRPAAQLMYEDADKRRIAIFVAANNGSRDTAFVVAKKGEVTACYWLSEDLGFVITGETSRDKLMSLANAVYHQFES